jgi:uncharacterized membrane protein YebE (DUF533 family)
VQSDPTEAESKVGQRKERRRAEEKRERGGGSTLTAVIINTKKASKRIKEYSASRGSLALAIETGI